MRLTEIIKKNAMAIVAMVIATGSLTIMSFEKRDSEEVVTLKYRYDLSNPSGIESPSNWTDVSNESNPQGCQQNQPLPCLVEFTDAEFANLEEFLEEHDNEEAIMGSGYVTATKPIL